MKRLFTVGILTLVSFAASLSAQLRVGLFQKELPVQMTISAARGLHLFNGETGKEIGFQKSVHLEKRDAWVVFQNGREEARVRSLRVEPAARGSFITVETPRGDTRDLSGALIFEARTRELLAINELDEEDYVAQATEGEIPTVWPAEVVAAQAIMARTYAERHRGRHGRDGYDLCDITHCQVVRGARVSERAVRAAESTRHYILTAKGQPIDALFHSTCGGATSDSNQIWANQPGQSYLRGRTDGANGEIFCQRSPYFNWDARVPKGEIEGLARAWNLEGPLEGISVTGRDSAGRAKTIEIWSAEQRVQIDAERFFLDWGRRRGWNELKSRRFDIRVESNSVVVAGHGMGHGVGLCQYGAKAQAEAGRTHSDILSFYFPGTTLAERRPRAAK